MIFPTSALRRRRSNSKCTGIRERPVVVNASGSGRTFFPWTSVCGDISNAQRILPMLYSQKAWRNGEGGKVRTAS